MGIDPVQGIGELHIESGIVFGRDVLAVWLFAHFHAGDWVTAGLEIADFRGGIPHTKLDCRG